MAAYLTIFLFEIVDRLNGLSDLIASYKRFDLSRMFDISEKGCYFLDFGHLVNQLVNIYPDTFLGNLFHEKAA